MFYIIKGKKLSHELNFNLFALSIKNLSESKAELKLELIILYTHIKSTKTNYAFYNILCQSVF